MNLAYCSFISIECSLSYTSPQSFDSRELYKFMFHHFGCVSLNSNFPYEHATEFVPVTKPARLPSSYEEALSHYVNVTIQKRPLRASA